MASDSLIGYVTNVLNSASSSDSSIGYATGTISDPGVASDSIIGYVSSVLYPPHAPIGTWNGAAVVWRPIRTWNGSDLV